MARCWRVGRRGEVLSPKPLLGEQHLPEERRHPVQRLLLAVHGQRRVPAVGGSTSCFGADPPVLNGRVSVSAGCARPRRLSWPAASPGRRPAPGPPPPAGGAWSA